METAFITVEQLDEAVSLQRQTQEGRLGEWLLRLGFVEEHQITLALSKQYGIPLIDLSKSETKTDAIRMIPGKVAKCSNLLPVGFDDHQDSLRIAVSGPVNFNSQEAIRRMLQKGLLTYIGDESAIRTLIERWYDPDELDLSKAPTFGTFEDLLEIAEDIVSFAMNQRAENIQAELLDEYLWIRLDFRDSSRHQFYRHAPAAFPYQETLSQRQQYPVAAVA